MNEKEWIIEVDVNEKCPVCGQSLKCNGALCSSWDGECWDYSCASCGMEYAVWKDENGSAIRLDTNDKRYTFNQPTEWMRLREHHSHAH